VASASSFAIRLAEPADSAVVTALVRAAYAHYVPRMGREPGPMTDDYAALIEDGRVHVAGADGSVQGVLVLLPEADAMLLDNIAVDPARKGAGLGRALLAFAEQQTREAGYRAIRLYTHVTMTENIALYTRIGYVETHRGEEKGFHRVYMTKVLA
jgi:GNAT superfamily N-acetyltransferase